MCMTSETVEALHAITAELKAEHARRDTWLADFDAKTDPMLEVTRAEAERIFADRIAAHEARLKEQGWTRTVRVEPSSSGAVGSSGAGNPAS